MTYIRVKWLHSNFEEPVLRYSELNDLRWETRKVEIFADGRFGFAGPNEASEDTGLGLAPVPSLHEIAADPGVRTRRNHPRGVRGGLVKASIGNQVRQAWRGGVTNWRL